MGENTCCKMQFSRLLTNTLRSRAVVGAAIGGSAFHSGYVHCHGGHSHGDAHLAARLELLEDKLASLEAQHASRYGFQTSTGQGDAVFSWEEGLTAALPDECRKVEQDMHGGFNEDAETGIVYTGIPGAGLYAISQDLKTWTKLGHDKRLEDNCHGLVVFKHQGNTMVAIAQNDAERVLIVDLQGNVQQTLCSPRGGEFNFGEANGYYSEKRHLGAPKLFSCTDVTFMDGKLYVVTGYCDGDFVLTAEVGSNGQWQWGPTAWGGKGDRAGQFQTAHGVTAHNNHIYVANREKHQVVKFTKDGDLVEIMPEIPAGSRICNIAHAEHHNYFVMNALAPIPHTGPRSAPIYAHTGNHLISVIDAGSLGIPVLKHIHHVYPHYVTSPSGEKKLYLLVHGWRHGKFAVLKHEPAGGAPAAVSI